MTRIRYSAGTLAAMAVLASTAMAQGVAFQPVVGSIQNGPSLGVTGVVSHDRRYVRIGVNPQFIAVEGFTRYPVPGAVGGGPGGPGALQGLGLGGGGLGAGGAGAGGGKVLAGMDGILLPRVGSGLEPIPADHGFIADRPTAQDNAPGPIATPAKSQANGATPSRVAATKVLRRGRNPREKLKHPSSASASPTSSVAK